MKKQFLAVLGFLVGMTASDMVSAHPGNHTFSTFWENPLHFLGDHFWFMWLGLLVPAILILYARRRSGTSDET